MRRVVVGRMEEVWCVDNRMAFWGGGFFGGRFFVF